jgi:nicotinamidase-related amidase
MKMALMVIDLQKAYLNEYTERYMKSACEYINAVIPLFRKDKLPIIWVQNKDEYDRAVPGNREFEFIDYLKPEEGDFHIVKEYGNTFNKTNCYEIIKAHGVDTLLITGFSAEYCVLSTYRGALDLDLTPVILKNGIASDNREAIDFVERISSIMSYSVVAKILSQVHLT